MWEYVLVCVCVCVLGLPSRPFAVQPGRQKKTICGFCGIFQASHFARHLLFVVYFLLAHYTEDFKLVCVSSNASYIVYIYIYLFTLIYSYCTYARSVSVSVTPSSSHPPPFLISFNSKTVFSFELCFVFVFLFFISSLLYLLYL